MAEWIDRALTSAIEGRDDALERVAAEIREFLTAFPMPGFGAATD